MQEDNFEPGTNFASNKAFKRSNNLYTTLATKNLTL